MNMNEWNCYQSLNIDDVVFISFNSKIMPEISDLPFEKLLTIRIKIVDPTENGLPKKNEFSILDSIEDTLDPLIENMKDNVKVGRVTMLGGRFLYYYGNLYHEEEVKKIINKIASDYNYDIKFNIKEDKLKKLYFEFLYPSEAEWQTISNQDVLRVLLKQGDSLIETREIDHLIKFKNKNQCHDFSCWAEKNGFRVKENEEKNILDDGSLVYEYTSLLSHDLSDLHKNIDDITLSLYYEAKKYEGEYDGWGCIAQISESNKK